MRCSRVAKDPEGTRRERATAPLPACFLHHRRERQGGGEIPLHDGAHIDCALGDQVEDFVGVAHTPRPAHLADVDHALDTLFKLHEVLLDSVRGYNKSRGKMRTSQNWIGPQGCTIEEATFVPPSPMGLQDHLNRWESYWHEEDRDALVQLAVIHAQFEILHPFLDGNGRLGRMVIPLFLFDKGLLSRPCFYLSAYFEAEREAYIARLRELGHPGSWTRWCAFFLEGIVKQAEANTRKAIHDLYDDLKRRVLDLTHSQYAVPLLDYMFQRPIFRSSEVAKNEHMPSIPMVANLLKTLRENGVLTTLREGAGRRPHVLALSELINLCEGTKVVS